MRRDGSVQSVRRNVSEAFDSSMGRLDELYQSARAIAPTDFITRIDFWRDSCGLPEQLAALVHTLRIWRNASVHLDEERWARDGPPSAEAATSHIAELDARLRELEAART